MMGMGMGPRPSKIVNQVIATSERFCVFNYFFPCLLCACALLCFVIVIIIIQGRSEGPSDSQIHPEQLQRFQILRDQASSRLFYPEPRLSPHLISQSLTPSQPQHIERDGVPRSGQPLRQLGLQPPRLPSDEVRRLRQALLLRPPRLRQPRLPRKVSEECAGM